MDSGQELELEVRRLLSSEVQEHREFLQSQIKYVSWGAGILLTLTIALLGYYFGKSLPETKAQLLAAIDAKVIDYRIVETVKARLEERVDLAVDSVVSSDSTRENIDAQVSMASATVVSKAASEVEDRILQTVEREIRSAQNSTAEQLLERVSLPKGAVL